MRQMQIYDILIIGGGVIGCAIAREFSRYRLKTAVLEKQPDVCCETSGRNTGMLHAGFTYPPGSLKARCAVEGNQEFDRVAEELDVPFRRTGKLIIGFTDDHRKSLLRFKARGEANGVKGLEIVGKDRIKEMEPGAGGNFAMYSPASGILDPFAYTIALAENARQNGAEFYFCTEVTSADREDGIYTLHTNRGDYHSRWVVNAAGLCSAEVSAMLGIPGYTIRGFKGEYIVLDKRAGRHMHMPVYPAPNEKGGFDIHATPTVDGNILVGPNSEVVSDFSDYGVTPETLAKLFTDGKKMFEAMTREDFIRNFSGIRPKRVNPQTGEVLDFVLETRREAPHVINLVGIESPGLTCALPLARRAVALLGGQEDLIKKENFSPRHKGIIRFAQQSNEVKRRLIAENPDYGEIICRCENVTRAEVLAAVHNCLGVDSLTAVKNRTRAMMGRCQGGYCQTRIARIIEREKHKRREDILYSRRDSHMFVGQVRNG